MKKIYQKRLTKLALALLRNRDSVELNMDSFRGGWRSCEDIIPIDWQCGTTCCFAGYAPEVFTDSKSFQKVLTDKGSTWNDITLWIIGSAGNCGDHELEALWSNLFGAGWPNDPLAAVRRALYVLEHPEEATEELRLYEPPYKSFGPKKLEQRLAAFA